MHDRKEMSVEEKEIKQYHFFSSSVLHFITDDDLGRCIRRQTKADKEMKSRGFNIKSCNVWKIPQPLEGGENYAIEFYEPQVEGRIFLDTIDYGAK